MPPKKPRRWRPTFRVPDEAAVIEDCQHMGPNLIEWLELQVVLKSFDPLETRKDQDVFYSEGWRGLADKLLNWHFAKKEEPTKVKRSAKR